MPWTPPRTWQVRDPLGSNDLNTYVRDNPTYLYDLITSQSGLGLATGWQNIADLTGFTGFQNGWTAGAPTPRICIHADGTIAMQGGVSAGTISSSTVLFQLPAGWQPSVNWSWLVATSGGVVGGAHLQLNNDGTLHIYAAPSGTSGVNLDSCEWRLD